MADAGPADAVGTDLAALRRSPDSPASDYWLADVTPARASASVTDAAPRPGAAAERLPVTADADALFVALARFQRPLHLASAFAATGPCTPGMFAPLEANSLAAREGAAGAGEVVSPPAETVVTPPARLTSTLDGGEVNSARTLLGRFGAILSLLLAGSLAFARLCRTAGKPRNAAKVALPRRRAGEAPPQIS